MQSCSHKNDSRACMVMDHVVRRNRIISMHVPRPVINMQYLYYQC